jgi:hypothetical protein
MWLEPGFLARHPEPGTELASYHSLGHEDNGAGVHLHEFRHRSAPTKEVMEGGGECGSEPGSQIG